MPREESKQVRKGRYYKSSLGGAKTASSVIGEGCLAILMGFIFKLEPDLVQRNTKLNSTTLICTV